MWIFWIGLLLCISFSPSAKSEDRTIHLSHIHNCKEYEDLPLQWGEVKMASNSKLDDAMFNLKINVKTEIKNFGMEFNFWKCETENFDSCEKFLKGYRVADVCPFLSKKNQFWSTFLEKIEPQITCPVKPGLYTVVNMPFHSRFMSFFPIHQRIVRARLLGLDAGKLVSCVDVEVLFRLKNM